MAGHPVPGGDLKNATDFTDSTDFKFVKSVESVAFFSMPDGAEAGLGCKIQSGRIGIRQIEFRKPLAIDQARIALLRCRIITALQRRTKLLGRAHVLAAHSQMLRHLVVA